MVAADYGLWLAAYPNGYAAETIPRGRVTDVEHGPVAVRRGLAVHQLRVRWRHRPVGREHVLRGRDHMGRLRRREPGAARRQRRGHHTLRQYGGAATTPDAGSTGGCGSSCVTIQSGQTVSQFWSDWWNVTVPSGDPNRMHPATWSATTATPPQRRVAHVRRAVRRLPVRHRRAARHQLDTAHRIPFQQPVAHLSGRGPLLLAHHGPHPPRVRAPYS